jgi:flagellar protein FliS
MSVYQQPNDQPYGQTPNAQLFGSSQQYAKQYKTQEIQTASQEEILILLYDGAIRFLKIAKKAMNAEPRMDIEKAHNNLIKAQRIISEFMLSLDMEVGGELAQNLYRLYDYLHYRLVQANIKKDATMVDEVIEHLKELRQTWKEAIQNAANEKASTQPGKAANHA